MEFFVFKGIFKKIFEFNLIELGLSDGFILGGASRNERAEFGCELGQMKFPTMHKVAVGHIKLHCN